MNQLITPRTAWWFTATSIAAGTAWCLWTTLIWQLPFHPWASIAIATAILVSMYAWTATNAQTLHRLHQVIRYWNISVFAALLLALFFGPAKQPFPQFALSLILKAGVILVLTVTWWGLQNLYRHITADTA